MIKELPFIKSTDYKRLVFPLAVSIAAALLVHFTLYSNGLMTPDGVWRGEVSVNADYNWEVGIGRWGLFLVNLLHGGVNGHFLMAFAAVACFALGAVLLTEVFQVKGKWKAALVAASVTCSPMVAITLAYPYTSDGFGLSFLTAVLAVYVFAAVSNDIICIGAGILCTAISLSLYQCNLGTQLAAAAGYILLSLLNKPEENKRIFVTVLKMAVAYILGFVLYYALVILFQKAWNVPMTDYKGSGSVGFSSIVSNLGPNISSAYHAFKAFFADSWLASNAYGERFAYAAIAAIAAVSLLLRVFRIRRYPIAILAAVFLIIVFPLCCNITMIAVNGSGIYLIMTSGLMVTVPLLFAISDWEGPDIRRYLTKAAAILTLLLVWQYTLTNQTDAIIMQMNKDQTVQAANRIWQRLETEEAYVHGETKLLIAGLLYEGSYPIVSDLYDRSNDYARWGLTWNTYDGNANTWHEYYRRFLGIDYNMCSPEQFEQLAALEEFEQMPVFPAAGSVRMIDDVMVVKLSEIIDWY